MQHNIRRCCEYFHMPERVSNIEMNFVHILEMFNFPLYSFCVGCVVTYYPNRLCAYGLQCSGVHYCYMRRLLGYVNIKLEYNLTEKYKLLIYFCHSHYVFFLSKSCCRRSFCPALLINNNAILNTHTEP